MKLTEGFNLLATAPDGIKSLRELILSLAVQGKLVPQDANDEPASELLKQIRAEKDRLIAEGKIKKDKPLPAIGDDEKPFELPEGWEWTRLQNLALPQAGFAFKSTHFNDSNIGLPLVRIRDVGVSNPATFYSGDYRDEFLVHDGDWLISMDGDFRVAEWKGACALLNQRVTRLIFFGFVQQKLISIALQAELSKLQGTKAYTTVDHLSGGQIANCVIPVPPLAEQSRIVAKVEELMALCDALEARGQLEAEQHTRLTATLFDALAASESAHALQENWTRLAASFDLVLDRPQAVDALEQTLLQLAVRGLLVPQDPRDEPASELLKQIRAEKDRLIAEGKIKKDKPLPTISDEEKPFELPQGWEWVRTPQITESRLGKMLDKAKNTGAAYPYLRNTNVQWRRFALDDIKEIFLEAHELEEFRLQNGDLLVCEGGEPGRCAIWRDEVDEMYFQKALHRIRPLGGVQAEFIALCLECDAFSGRLNEYFTGATIKHFAGQELNRYTIPLPPLAEQARIVARVEALRALCGQLRERLATSRQTQAHLAEALVAQT